VPAAAVEGVRGEAEEQAFVEAALACEAEGALRFAVAEPFAAADQPFAAVVEQRSAAVAVPQSAAGALFGLRRARWEACVRGVV
jgi:hypothetical protein